MTHVALTDDVTICSPTVSVHVRVARSNRDSGSFLFRGDLVLPEGANQLDIDRHGFNGSPDYLITDGIVIESGAPAIKLHLGGGSGDLRSDGDLIIVNNSDQLFSLGNRIQTNHREPWEHRAQRGRDGCRQ